MSASTPGAISIRCCSRIGLVFMAVAAVDFVMGSQQQFVTCPRRCKGQFDVLGVGIGDYRLFIIVVCGAAYARRCSCILPQTRFGSRLRAAVDDPRVARGLGINVGAVFAITFAVGSGLAGLGGALGARNPRPRSDLPAQIS